MGWLSYLPSPIAFSLGPVQVHWYGLFLLFGVLAAYAVSRPRFHAAGYKIDDLESLTFWLLIGGLVGARLVDVFVFEWGYFQNHLSEVWHIWQGGLAWHGGLAGGVVAAWCFAKQRRLPLLMLGDLLAPGLALGQAIGRIGNYFNQELFGLPTSLPWGIPIAPQNRPSAFVYSTHFHPTFLYESLGLLFIAWLVWRYSQATKATGRTFATYLLATGCLRFLLEFLRIDEQLSIGSVRVGFITAVAVALAGGLVWLHSSRTAQPAQT